MSENFLIEPNYIISNLSERPECYNEFIQLIEQEFHYNASTSQVNKFEIDFAPLVDPNNYENCYFYFDQKTESIVATMAALQRVLIKKNALLPIVIIGGVATHSKHRKKKLFSSLIKHITSSHVDKCGLFLLWSEHSELFEREAFYQTGGTTQTSDGPFSRNSLPHGFIKTTFSNLTKNEFDDLQKLYSEFNEKYFFTVARKPKDWEIIRHMNSIDLYIRKNDQEEIIQYFCINKGRDLIDIIHEFSCRPENYLSLVEELSKYKLWLPETEMSLSPNRKLFYSFFARLGDLNHFKSFIEKSSNHEIKLIDLSDHAVTYTYKDTEFQHSHRDFLQYLFGPRPLLEFAPYNLSLYIPGTDSV